MKPSLSIVANINVGVANHARTNMSLRVKGDSQRIRAGFSYKFRLALIASIAFMLICDSTARATCIVIRRTPSEIVVGADSKEVTFIFVTDSEGKEQQLRTEGTICKIRQAGNTFYAIAGINIPDIYNLADMSCRNGKTYAEKAAKFEALISGPLTVILDKARRENPGFYQTRFIAKSCLEIAFFGIENGMPAYRTVDFIAVNSLSEPVRIRQHTLSCPGTVPATFFMTSVMGYTNTIKALNFSESFWTGLDTIKGIKKLIAIETAAGSDDVGGAVDIIRITRNKTAWIQHKPECPDIQPYTAPEQRKKPTRKSKRRG